VECLSDSDCSNTEKCIKISDRISDRWYQYE